MQKMGGLGGLLVRAGADWREPGQLTLAWRPGYRDRRPAVDGYLRKEGTGATACAGYLLRSDGNRSTKFRWHR